MEKHDYMAQRLLMNLIEGVALESPNNSDIHHLLATNVEDSSEWRENIIKYRTLFALVDKLDFCFPTTPI